MERQGNSRRGCGISIEERTRQRRIKRRWLKSCVDPQTKEGRHVFRRGCHPQSISQVLGGNTSPWPLVSCTPPKIDDQANPFIDKGEFFIAGTEAWNPYLPRFPGDSGLVNIRIFEQDGISEKQTEFHVFSQCSRRRDRRNWHGAKARGGRLYCGVYRRLKHRPDADMVVDSVHVPFKKLDEQSRREIATFVTGKEVFRTLTELHKYKLTESVFEEAKRVEGEDKWNAMSERQRKVAAMCTCLDVNNFTFHLVAIEYVRYDEALYRRLVDIGATKEVDGVVGAVSLDPKEIGLY